MMTALNQFLNLIAQLNPVENTVTIDHKLSDTRPLVSHLYLTDQLLACFISSDIKS